MAEQVLSELVVRARGDVSEAQTALETLDGDLNNMETRTNRVVNVVGGAAAAAGGAILAAGAYGVKAAIDWESAFADVRKTVDGTPEELADLEDALRDMASDGVLGSLEGAHTQLAGIAALAGQLGVETTDIAEFTRIMGMMAVATNVSSEEAAVFAARFANITGMDMTDLEGFADTIVTLGNNMAAQESDIVSFANRLASLANFDFSPDEILAYSAAMASLGLTAELGSSNMLKTIQDITMAVAADAGQLQVFAEAAGMTADEFAELNANDPSAAFDAFIQGLSGMSADEQLITLDDLNIKGSEQIRVLTTMAAGYETVAQASGIATEAYQGNNALVDEATAKSETAAGGIAELGNKLNDMAVTVGDILMPVLDPLLTILGDILDVAAGFMQGLDIWGGLGAWGDSLALAGDVLQIVMDRITRNFERFGLDLRMRVADFVSGLRETVLNATGGQLDIAPDINFEMMDVQQAVADMDFADTMRDAINGALQGEDFDITDALFGMEGFEHTLTPTEIQNLIDFGSVEEGFGFEARRAVERGLRAALEEGDTENAALLEPLALALEIDVDAIKTENVMEDLRNVLDFGSIADGLAEDAKAAVAGALSDAWATWWFSDDIIDPSSPDNMRLDALEALAISMDIDTDAIEANVTEQMTEAINQMSVEDAEVDTTVEPLIDEPDLQQRVADTVGSITFAADAQLDLRLTANVTTIGAPDLGGMDGMVARAQSVNPAVQGPAPRQYHSGGLVDFGGASEGWAWLAAGETVRTQAQEASLQRQMAAQSAQNAVNILINSYGQSMRDLAMELRQETASMGYMN